VRRCQKRITSTDNYGGKLKPTAKKTRKHDKKLKNTKKAAALLALGMLAIIPGTIAGSTLTKSTNQVLNVATQATFGYCLYTSYTGANSLGRCVLENVLPVGGAVLLYAGINYGTAKMGDWIARIGAKWGWRDVIDRVRVIVLQASRFLKFTPKVGVIILA
jgi:hypothetical protein